MPQPACPSIGQRFTQHLLPTRPLLGRQEGIDRALALGTLRSGYRIGR